jgi:hypothetical protein
VNVAMHLTAHPKMIPQMTKNLVEEHGVRHTVARLLDDACGAARGKERQNGQEASSMADTLNVSDLTVL